MRSVLRTAAWLAAASALSCSAGSKSDTPYGNQSGGNGGFGGQNDDSGTYLPDGSAGSGGVLPANPEAGADVNMSDGGTCSALKVPAEPYPLDMYIMMDQSGSMSSPVNLMQPLGPTQWDAVKSAFVNFLNATPSTGLSMGIQYFPLPAVPWSSIPACSSSGSGCNANQVCADIGAGYHCMDKCSSAANCPPDFDCHAFEDDNGNSVSLCNNDTCNEDAYATPEVEIAPLPGVNAAILASLDAHGPLTMTPSAPSLKGAIKHARAWATAHPDTTTIVVLATDGMPTVCTSGGLLPITEVQQIAAEGVNGTPSIKTFVIGVVPAAMPQVATALNSIAANGGTGQAFIIDPAQDMTGAFAAALEAIRGAYMECSFQIPAPSGMPNWDEVNVIYTAVDSTVATVYYVEDISQCDPVLGGWYYDIPPSQGTPTKIVLCPQSCQFVQSYGGTIDIEIGCKTLTPPK